MSKFTTVLIVVLIVVICPISAMADQHLTDQHLTDQHTVILPIVTNGDIDPLYAYAPAKPFWRRGAWAWTWGKVSGTAIITGLQTIVIRYYQNDSDQSGSGRLRWYLVAPDDDTWIGGELLRFGTFVWDNETALILIVPTTDRLMRCQADTLIAVANGQVYGRATFLPPCKEQYNSYNISPSMTSILRFWK